MYSSVQVVFLFDVNCLNNENVEKNSSSVHISKFTLSCLRLLTEFGAQTENDGDVRWAAKYYDSTSFKPGKANSKFCDFNKKTFDSFCEEIKQKFVSIGDVSKNKLVSNKSNKRTSNLTEYTHCFILNKAIQEALKDYNWDIPDANSPKLKKTRKSTLNEDKFPDHLISIIVFNNVPHNIETVQKFIGDSTWGGSAKNFSEVLLENSTRLVLEDCKAFKLHFVDVAAKQFSADCDPLLRSSISDCLSKFNGSLHCISSLVDCKKILETEDRVSCIPIIPPHLRELSAGSFLKPTKNIKNRVRKPQNGPELIWEDSNGTSFLKIKLEVVSLQGKVPVGWREAHVTCIAKAGGSVLSALSSVDSQIILCREQNAEDASRNVIFSKILSSLQKYNLVFVLRFSCDGLAVLSPWLGSVACIVVLSSSGLACPPINRKENIDTLLSLGRDPMLNFIKAAINKSLKTGGGVAEELFPDAQGLEAIPHFSRCLMEPWYPRTLSSATPSTTFASKSLLVGQRHALLNRARRRCCPQISKLFCNAADNSAFGGKLNAGGGSGGIKSLISGTGLKNGSSKSTSAGSKNPAVLGASAGQNVKPSASASRALQLVNKSKIVTAQQKVKEMRDEEEEREVERERKVQQSNLRTQKSQALINSALSTISDTKDGSAIVDSLIQLRDSVNGKMVDPSVYPEGAEGCDLFGTAQTIINVALMHVRSNNEARPSEGAGEGLRDILQPVLHSSKAISALPQDCQLPQFQLHTLLHLEIMWLMGYSSLPAEEDSDSSRAMEREEYLEEILKLLRGMTLKFDPATTTAFLTNTVLHNYEETLSEVLTEVYEELNQPLPATLAGPASVATAIESPGLQHSNKPTSALSSTSMIGSGGVPSGIAGALRRRHSNLAVVAGGGAGGRQVVVPGSRMARLTRAASDQARGTAIEKKAASKKSQRGNGVRRSLFENNSSQEALSVTPSKERNGKRKRSCETVSSILSPLDNKRARLMRTPRDERKRKSNFHLEDDRSALGCEELFTPSKKVEASPVLSRNSAIKIGRVLVPSTPHHLAGMSSQALRRGSSLQNVANTSIAESPDVKSDRDLTPRRRRASLMLKRRSSFYSGGESRNCQKVKTNLMVKRLQNKSRNSSKSKDVSRNVVLKFGLDQENSSAKVEKGFLFSKIVGSAPAGTSFKTDNFGRRRGLRRMLNFDNIDNDEDDQPSNEDKSFNPLKNLSSCSQVVRKSDGNFLDDNMTTPTKKKTPDNGSKSLCGAKTPKRGDIFKNILSPLAASLTPSKRVQFSLQYTPSKNSTGFIPSTTPKSILKTPNKTPSKILTPVRSSLFGNTPRRTPLKLVRTPRRKLSRSPELFSSQKKCIAISSPNRTPSKLSSPFKRTSPRRCSPRSGKSPKNVPGWLVSASPSKSPRIKTTPPTVQQIHRRSLRNLNFECKNSNEVTTQLNDSIKTKDCSTFTQTLTTSSDSAISMNKSSCSSSTTGLSSPFDILAQPSKISQNVNSVEEFFETLDQMAQITENHEITEEDVSFINDLVVPQPTHCNPEVNFQDFVNFTNENHDNSQNSAVDESVNSASFRKSGPPPLLDIRAMAEQEKETIILNNAWNYDDNESDSNENSSPEIEIPPELKKVVKVSIEKLKDDARHNKYDDVQSEFRVCLENISEGKCINSPLTEEEDKSCPNLKTEAEVENKKSLRLSQRRNSESSKVTACNVERPKSSRVTRRGSLSLCDSRDSLSPHLSNLSSDLCSPLSVVIQRAEPPAASSIEEKSNRSSIEEKSNRSSIEEKSNRSSIKEKSNRSSIEEKSNRSSIEEKSNRSSIEEKSNRSSIKEKSNRSSIEEKSNRSSIEKKSNRSFIEEKSNRSSIEEKSNRSSIEEKTNRSSIEEKTNRSSIEEKSNRSLRRTVTERIERNPKKIEDNLSGINGAEDKSFSDEKSTNDSFLDNQEVKLEKRRSTRRKFSSRKLPTESRRSCRNIDKINYFCDESSNVSDVVDTVTLSDDESYDDNIFISKKLNDNDSKKVSKVKCTKKLSEKSDSSNKENHEIEHLEKNNCDDSSSSNDLSIFSTETKHHSGSVKKRKKIQRQFFSSTRLISDENLGVTPLKDVENIPSDGKKRETRKNVRKSYAEMPSDLSEFEHDSSMNTFNKTGGSSYLETPPITSTCVRRAKRRLGAVSDEKRSKFLSPVVNAEYPELKQVGSPQMLINKASGEIDWKQVKPITTRQNLEKELEFSMKGGGEKKKKPLSKRAKRKKVKLKLKKTSEDNYEVSQNASSCSTSVTESSFNSHNSSKAAEKKKNSKFITPLRFTRHMSKDLSITPEFFQRLTCDFPAVKDPDAPKSPLESTSDVDMPRTPIQRKLVHPKLTPLKDVWRVESSSPTMKTFIRVQSPAPITNPSSITNHQPSVPMSPALTSPSVKSVLHLSMSPIVQKVTSKKSGRSINPIKEENEEDFVKEGAKRKRNSADNSQEKENEGKRPEKENEVKRPRNESKETNEVKRPRNESKETNEVKRPRTRRVASGAVANTRDSNFIMLSEFTDEKKARPRSSKRLYIK